MESRRRRHDDSTEPTREIKVVVLKCGIESARGRDGGKSQRGERYDRFKKEGSSCTGADGCMWHPWIDPNPPSPPTPASFPGPASSPVHQLPQLPQHAHTSIARVAVQDSIQALLSLVHPRSSRRRQRRPCSSAGWRSHLPPIQVGFDRIVHLSTRAWGASSSTSGPLARQGNKRNETGCTTSLHEGSAAARNPTHRSPAACQGKPMSACLSSRPQPDNHTSRAPAGDQLVWPPWPLRPAVRDHKG